jgi:hypothetical protein
MENQNNNLSVVEQGSDLQVLSQQGMPFKTIISETASQLSDILMANIKKVQDDPAFVPQAKEVRDNVRELVNLARVEIDMIREARKVVVRKNS